MKSIISLIHITSVWLTLIDKGNAYYTVNIKMHFKYCKMTFEDAMNNAQFNHYLIFNHNISESNQFHKLIAENVINSKLIGSEILVSRSYNTKKNWWLDTTWFLMNGDAYN